MRVFRTFKADMAKLSEMMEWVRAGITQGQFSSLDQQKIEVAMEEALVNIIQYAHPTGAGQIEIVYDCYPTSIEWRIRDRGIPFNPLEHPGKIDLDAPLEEREAGGLGIPFIQLLMDEVAYAREGEFNVFILKKYWDT